MQAELHLTVQIIPEQVVVARVQLGKTPHQQQVVMEVMVSQVQLRELQRIIQEAALGPLEV